MLWNYNPQQITLLNKQLHSCNIYSNKLWDYNSQQIMKPDT